MRRIQHHCLWFILRAIVQYYRLTSVPPIECEVCREFLLNPLDLLLSQPVSRCWSEILKWYELRRVSVRIINEYLLALLEKYKPPTAANCAFLVTRQMMEDYQTMVAHAPAASAFKQT